MDKSIIKKLLSGLCCNVCKHDFDEESIIIKRAEKNLMVIQIVCPECGKSFGIALLGIGSVALKDKDSETALEIQPTPMPITYDDVLDAHKFIDKLEKDWSKYIPDEFKNIKNN